MGRHRHNRAGSVLNQYKVGQVDRHLPTIGRVDAVASGKNPFFFQIIGSTGDPVGFLNLVNERLNLSTPLRSCQFKRHRVFRRKGHKGGAEQGVGTGSKDADRTITAIQGKINFTAGALADPVALHDQHPLRPARQLVGKIKQLLGIVGDLKKPLLQLFLHYLGITAPAAAILHLLIGQYGLTGGAPVDKRLLLVGDPLFVHLNKQLLLPAVVADIAGGQFTVPVIGKPHLLQLIPHVGHVFIGPGSRVAVILDGSVFCRHTKGIPAHRMQHVKPAHPLETAYYITYRVVADMSHMNPAGGVRKHLQQVVFWPERVFRHLEGLVGFPMLLPLVFNL